MTIYTQLSMMGFVLVILNPLINCIVVLANSSLDLKPNITNYEIAEIVYLKLVQVALFKLPALILQKKDRGVRY